MGNLIDRLKNMMEENQVDANQVAGIVADVGAHQQTRCSQCCSSCCGGTSEEEVESSIQ